MMARLASKTGFGDTIGFGSSSLGGAVLKKLALCLTSIVLCRSRVLWWCLDAIPEGVVPPELGGAEGIILSVLVAGTKVLVGS